MIDIGKEARDLASWPARERTRALQRILPRADVEACLGGGRAACPRLPGWFMVWFVVALGLCCRDCHRQVFRWLQPRRPGGVPPRSTLCEARKRLGVAPLRRLAESAIHLLGKPATPGAFYRGMRLMALDGFTVDVADTPRNARAFGRPGTARAPGAFPQARVLALCETGSHVLWRWQIKPIAAGEATIARGLLCHLRRGMLLLWDRNFFGYRTLAAVVGRRAYLLARVASNRRFDPVSTLSDGTYLARCFASESDRRVDRGGITVRVVTYMLDDPSRPGRGEVHRLVTTLLDERGDPAEDLIVLYHERWEQELAIDELKTHQRERPVLRSQTPAGVVQELYGLMLGHYVVRALMQEAAGRRGLDPERLSFTAAVKVLRCRLPECPGSRRGRGRWYEALLADVGEEVLPKRRDRINPRVIRRKMSHWLKKRPEHRNYPQPSKEFRKAIVMLR
ncbi:MAG TPA: IS4 family transposase [Isosphaeraceae bacterium]